MKQLISPNLKGKDKLDRSYSINQWITKLTSHYISSFTLWNSTHWTEQNRIKIMQKLKKLNFNQNSSCKISFHNKKHIRAVKITPKTWKTTIFVLKGVQKHKQSLSLYYHNMKQREIKKNLTKTVITRGLLLSLL